jgi:hypothetical protein
LRSRKYFLSTSIPVDAQSGQTRTITAPVLGTLNIYSRPENCPIFVDGTNVGTHPVLDLRIAPGQHRLMLQCAGQPRTVQTVSIASGRQQRATLESSQP